MSIDRMVHQLFAEGDRGAHRHPPDDDLRKAETSARRGAASRISPALVWALLLDAVARFLGREDAPRYIALALLAIVFVVMPWDMLAVVLLGGVAAGVVGCFLGKDQIKRLVIGWYRRTRERDPERAEAIRLFAARASRTASACLAKLPPDWTSGLYLPDFEEPQPTSPKLLSDPFERLGARAARQGN